MRKGFNLLFLLLLCFALSGCTTNHETKDGGTKLIPISDEIITKLSTTKSIIVKKPEVKNDTVTFNIMKTITDENEIKEIIDFISHSTEHVGDVNYIGASYDLEMYDKDGKLVDIIEIFDTNISIKSANNRYDLDVNDLKKIIES